MNVLHFLAAIAIALLSNFAQAIEPTRWSGFNAEAMTLTVTAPIPEKPEKLVLKPLLLKPASAPPWTSVVLPSSSAGLDDGMWPIQARALIDAGIAVVLVDSFNPRGVREVATNQFRVSYAARLQDVHQVLDFLRQDSRFVADKIAIGGHSNGGVMALLSAYADLADKLGRNASGKSAFNAFIATSAACDLTLKGTKLNGPLLLINGTKDDYCWPEPCIAEVQRLAAAGEPAKILLIEGAYHSLSTHGVTFNPRMMRAPKDAPHVFLKSLATESLAMMSIEVAATGEETNVRDLMKKHGGFLGRNLFGAHVGGAQDKAQEAALATTAHLKAHGW